MLYSFKGGSDGAIPRAGLIADEHGALYGTTINGGGNQGSGCNTGGCGTVFKLTPPGMGQTAWTETVLHSFTGSDGATPYASLIADEHGALYGTTLYGGTAGFGTVFKLTPPAKGQTAWTETVLYTFKNGTDGGNPSAGLIAKNGALYGTTSAGVTGYGTVFKLTPPANRQTAWTETTLYPFCSQPSCTDGAYPSGLIADEQGALYSTTTSGGADQGSGCNTGGCGTIFKLTPPAKGQTAWTETVLYSFTGTTNNDGAGPYAALIADHGALYGTTAGGGACCNGFGTVFKLTLSP